jgi:hypothetical protein
MPGRRQKLSQPAPGVREDLAAKQHFHNVIIPLSVLKSIVILEKRFPFDP